jgi:UDP-2,3-diacylglucosamine pyrophosphatase LpxH
VNSPVSPDFQHGIVVSDLHLFARRSRGSDQFNAIREKLRQVNILVLNGDIFDFRWSTLGDQNQTLPAAINWLRALAVDLPGCEIHFIIGNHDCIPAFQEELTRLATTQPGFHWHEYLLQIGPALFLHGDCTHYQMDHDALRRYRANWQRTRQWSPALAIAYKGLDWLGITQRVHDWHFPRQQTIERITFYLDHAFPAWRTQTRDCYFGHTHLPFTNHEHEGVCFHNTGAAINKQVFHPITFTLAGNTNGGTGGSLQKFIEAGAPGPITPTR